jgi:hypothetical protein
MAAVLPAELRRAFLPLCQRPVEPFHRLVVSLLLGAWTHLFLDSMAHEDGSLAECLPLLQHSINLPGRMSLTGSDLIYGGCTLLGVAWLAAGYWSWLERAAGSPSLTRPWVMRGGAFLFALLILCVAIAGRGDHRLLGAAGLGIISTLLLALFLMGTGWRVMMVCRSRPAASPRAKSLSCSG